MEVSMEPVSMITGAIAAGATAALKDTASSAVKDAYSALKKKLKKWFSYKENEKGEKAIEVCDGPQETWESDLKKALSETRADKENDIIEAVNTLMAELKETPGGTVILSKYNIQNCQIGFVAGDYAVINGGVHVGKP